MTDGTIEPSRLLSTSLLGTSLKGPAIPQTKEQGGPAIQERTQSTSAEGESSDSQSYLPLDHRP